MNVYGNAHPLILQYQKQHPACLSTRENTVSSLQRAAGEGASFVEFDVQVTKDQVPVIWHDDFVCFRRDGAEVQRQPVSSFAASEFQRLRQPGAPVQLMRRKITAAGISDTEYDDWNVDEDTAGLPTLAELFQQIPEGVGFDIEVKMTTPDTQISTEPDEINRMLQPILSTVQQALQTSSRKVFFSSFDPEMCQALRKRQQEIPVFFLSTGPASFKPHSDPRRTTVAAAIDWAHQTDLQGLVLDSGCFKSEPDAPKKAEEVGLATLTYGLGNNDPTWILHQRDLGVAAVVVDNVPAIVAAVTA